MSRNLCIDQKFIEDIYKSYWKFIKNQVSSISLKESSKEEFDTLDLNFNLPFLGKLYVEYYKVEKYKRKLKEREYAETEESKACGMSGASD